MKYSIVQEFRRRQQKMLLWGVLPVINSIVLFVMGRQLHIPPPIGFGIVMAAVAWLWWVAYTQYCCPACEKPLIWKEYGEGFILCNPDRCPHCDESFR